MTAAIEDEGDTSETLPNRISLVDSVCCVYFCASGKYALLIRILAGLGMEIFIPAEVEREVLRKKLGQVQAQWPRLRSSPRDASSMKHKYNEWQRSRKESSDA